MSINKPTYVKAVFAWTTSISMDSVFTNITFRFNSVETEISGIQAVSLQTVLQTTTYKYMYQWNKPEKECRDGNTNKVKKQGAHLAVVGMVMCNNITLTPFSMYTSQCVKRKKNCRGEISMYNLLHVITPCLNTAINAPCSSTFLLSFRPCPCWSSVWSLAYSLSCIPKLNFTALWCNTPPKWSSVERQINENNDVIAVVCAEDFSTSWLQTP